VEKKPFMAKGGLPRVKVKVRFGLLPNHLQIRAKKYHGLVDESSKRFKLQPQLILSVIHRESYFNTLAVSPANAHGLMQLIPQYGARDAYRMIYNRDRIVSAEYLYVTENKIELGSDYLSLLRDKSFDQIPDETMRLYLVIRACNWGSAAVMRKIVRKNNVDLMSSAELYQILRRKTPEETSNYLKRVTERMEIYERLYQ
jgi:membrane-bound lytic murein transglycosylase C